MTKNMKALRNIGFASLALLFSLLFFIHGAFYTFPPDMKSVRPFSGNSVVMVFLIALLGWVILTSISKIIEIEVENRIKERSS